MRTARACIHICSELPTMPTCSIVRAGHRCTCTRPSTLKTAPVPSETHLPTGLQARRRDLHLASRKQIDDLQVAVTVDTPLLALDQEIIPDSQAACFELRCRHILCGFKTVSIFPSFSRSCQIPKDPRGVASISRATSLPSAQQSKLRVLARLPLSPSKPPFLQELFQALTELSEDQFNLN